MNQHSFAFDIETRPNAELVAQAVGERIPWDNPELDLSQWKTEAGRRRNLKHWEDTREERMRKHEDKENEKYDKAMLAACARADRCSVLCISYAGWNENYVDWANGDEHALLQRLWDRCDDTQVRNGQIFHASGTNFDVRIPWRRSLHLGVRLPQGLRVVSLNKVGRPQINKTFVDLVEIYSAGEYGFYIKIDELAKSFGLEGKFEDEGVNGKNFWKHADEDKLKAERYALRDSQIVWELATALDACGLWINTNPQIPSQEDRKESLQYGSF